MLISLPVAMLVKKMGVTSFSLLLPVHLGFKNKSAPYLERELRRKGWAGLVVALCAPNTELHVLRYSSFQKLWGF